MVFSFFYFRKAELSIQVIIIMILAVIVLIILAFSYWSELSKLLGSFSNLISGAKSTG